MTNAFANAIICSLNDLVRFPFASISLVTSGNLTPETAKALEHSRDVSKSLRDADFSALLLMTKLVAVGVIFEGPEIVHDILKVIAAWRKKPNRVRAPAWITLVSAIGWLLIVVGVAGEFWADAKFNTDDGNVQSINQQLLGDARSAASEAVASAQSLSEEVDAIDKRAVALSGRLDAASARLSGIEDAVRWQGPRWRPLEAGKGEFVAALKPFAGQKVLITECGPARQVNPEVLKTGEDLFNFFGSSNAGAGWKADERISENCNQLGGITIVVSSLANEEAKDAAEALYGVLTKLHISAIKTEVPPGMGLLESRTLGPNWPSGLADKDRSEVVISIDENPMYDVFGWTKLLNKPHR
jgi:hypothetical protein